MAFMYPPFIFSSISVVIDKILEKTQFVDENSQNARLKLITTYYDVRTRSCYMPPSIQVCACCKDRLLPPA